MKDSPDTHWLAKAIGEVTLASKFCVGGCLPPVDPGLQANALGAIKLPLRPTVAKKLAGLCRVAPYGKGTKTLVNRKVRDTLELDNERFRLGPEWSAGVAR